MEDDVVRNEGKPQCSKLVVESEAVFDSNSLVSTLVA